MNKLEKQTRQINLVINYVIKDKETIDHINELVAKLVSSQYGGQYAYITHWFDTLDNGELKHIHTHFVIELPKRVRLITFLNSVSDYANIDTQYLTIDSTRSLNASIQYLLHLNDVNKYQYTKEMIYTNYCESDLDYLLNNNSSCLDFQNLSSIIIDSNGDLCDIIKALGISRYNMYRRVVIDMYCGIFGHAPYTFK